MLSKHLEQLERKETLENDLRVRDQTGTFFSHTHNDVGGRFAAISSPVVVGEKQIPQYPAAFLKHDPVPDEPPLGVDVNALEPTGEPHELKASIADDASLGPSSNSAKATSSAPPSSHSSPDGAEPGDPTDVPPPGAVGSPSFSSRSYRRF